MANKYGSLGIVAPPLEVGVMIWEMMTIKEKINIIFKEYDAEHFVVLLKRNSVKLFMDFGICGFER